MKRFTTTFNLKCEIHFQSFLNKMIGFVLFIVTIISSFNSLAQSENVNKWEFVNSQNGVEIYSQRIFCDIQEGLKPYEYVVFKVLNTSSEKLNIHLQFEIYFEEGCNGCQGKDETAAYLILNPGESIESSCSSLQNKLAYFILNPNFDGSWKYTHSKVIIDLIQQSK